MVFYYYQRRSVFFRALIYLRVGSHIEFSSSLILQIYMMDCNIYGKLTYLSILAYLKGLNNLLYTYEHTMKTIYIHLYIPSLNLFYKYICHRSNTIINSLSHDLTEKTD